MPRAEIPESAVGALARSLRPRAFEKPTGLGHQQFAVEDAEDRQAARDDARRHLQAAAQALHAHWLEQLKEELEERAEIERARDCDSLRSQIEAEVERLQAKGKRNAALIHFDQADRLQAILDSTSTEGEGRG